MSIENGLVCLLFLMLITITYFIIIPLVKIIIEEYWEEEKQKELKEYLKFNRKEYVYLNNLTFQLTVFDELYITDTNNLYEYIGEL